MMPDWYIMLTTTLAGKITLAVVMAAVLGNGCMGSTTYRPVKAVN
jgi:hypothetical protein